MQTSTLRPGLLVSLKTSVRGNVSYTKRDIEPDHLINDTARRAKWETERTISDAEEFAAASKARSEAGYCITRICAATAFGYLCPEERAAELDEAIRTARAQLSDFNSRARITRVALYVITGRVAPDDAEAVRAIRAELVDLMTDMERGVQALAPDKIREAANRARQLGSMLTEDARAKVDGAIEEARKTARAIAKASKAGEQAALVVDGQVTRAIASARTSFLDLDSIEDLRLPAEAFTPPPRALDLEAAPALF